MSRAGSSKRFNRFYGLIASILWKRCVYYPITNSTTHTST